MAAERPTAAPPTLPTWGTKSRNYIARWWLGAYGLWPGVAQRHPTLTRWKETVLPDSLGMNMDWQRRLDRGRLARMREKIAAYDCGAGLFYDPINIRYATGTANMQVYGLHNPCRYAFVPVEGPVILFEFDGCEHLSVGCAAVDEVRTATSWYHFVSGPRAEEFAHIWCAEIMDLVRSHAAGSRRLAIDRIDPLGIHLLEQNDIHIIDGFEVAHMARMIKTPEEIEAVRQSISVCEEGLSRMIEASAPGSTESEIWSILHQANIELGGEWIETRLLSSGPRTNPWYQEAGSRVIKAGDMIAVDTDLIGPHGYGADISRSWVAGDVAPTGDQKTLYALAHEQVEYNRELFVPGRSFFEIAELACQMPERYRGQQQPAIAHGSGLCNEFPLIIHAEKIEAKGHDGILEPGMVVCDESYAGAEGGREGVKLEQQILVSADGPELLSNIPFDDRLLA